MKDQAKLDEALACLRRALELKPDYAAAHCNLGNALRDQGNLDAAVECYRQTVQLEFGHTLPATRKIVTPRVAGCQPAAQTRPGHVARYNSLGLAFYELAMILRRQFPEEDLRVMRNVLREPDLRSDVRMGLHFGLAQALDARGEYDAAAEHLGAANAAALAALKERKREYRPLAFGILRQRRAGDFHAPVLCPGKRVRLAD